MLKASRVGMEEGPGVVRLMTSASAPLAAGSLERWTLSAYSVLGVVFPLHRSYIKLRIRDLMKTEKLHGGRRWRYFRCSLEPRKRATLECGCSSNLLGLRAGYSTSKPMILLFRQIIRLHAIPEEPCKTLFLTKIELVVHITLAHQGSGHHMNAVR